MGTATRRYMEIADALRAEILDGHLAPGAIVPSENEISTMYGVNRTTARHALGVLRTEGLIDVRQGARARVRETPVVRIMGVGADWRRHRDAGRPGFDATVAEHGLTPRQEILDTADPTPAPPDVAVRLDLDADAPVVMRYVRQYADDVPARLARLWFPAEWASGTALAGRKRIRGGVAALVEQLTGRRICGSVVEIGGRHPIPAEQGRTDTDGLGLADGVTVLDVTTVFLDAAGCPVYAQDDVVDATKHRYRFEVVF